MCFELHSYFSESTSSPVKDLLNSSYGDKLYSIKKIIDYAHVETTFWGNRIVKVKDMRKNDFFDNYSDNSYIWYENSGSFYLEDIAKKVLGAGYSRSKADDLLPKERIDGIEIVAKLKEFYKISDKQIQGSNFLTRFLNWLRELSLFPTKVQVEVGHKRFLAYSEEKFIKEFGNPGEDNPAYGIPQPKEPYPDNSILVNEEAIRKLLLKV